MRLFILLALLSFSCFSLANDLPTGSSTTEGVAADMAKAFIELDEAFWRSVVYKSANPEYLDFINEIASQMQAQSKLPHNDRSGPKEVKVIFKMGGLSKNWPNSFAYAVYELDEIGFVDVGVIDYRNERSITRTFVVKEGDRWYAIPKPDLFPLLTDGLNEEERPSEYVFPK